MAETWLAVQRGDAGFEQRVCLKLIHESLRNTPDFMRLFIREAAIAGSLRHSNIVGVIDASPSEGCMALELVEGADLRTVLAHAPDHRLPPAVTIFVALELCKALHYAHTRTRSGEFAGIVHRDVSPANVLCSYAGEIKLTDFGIAKAIRATGDVGSGIRGKLSYMSPEHIGARTLDARSDLFSLGVLLYEASSGRRPFDGENDVDTCERILRGDHLALARVAPDTPAELAQIIEVLLRVDPDARFPTAAAAIQALAPLAPPPTVYRELGQLASRALPHQTLSVELDIAGVLAGAKHPRGGDAIAHEPLAPTQTLLRPPVATTLGEFGAEPRRRGLADSRTGSLHWRRIGALAGALAATAVGGSWVLLPRAPGDSAIPLSEPPAWSAHTTSSRPDAVVNLAPLEPAQRSSGPPALAERDADDLPSTVAPGSPQQPGIGNAADPASGPSLATHRRAFRSRRDRSRTSDPTPQPAVPTGTVEVGVFPGGKVWVDGQLRGLAPLTLSLPAGRHTVAAGRDTPIETREVDITPEAAEQMIFKLRNAGGMEHR